MQSILKDRCQRMLLPSTLVGGSRGWSVHVHAGVCAHVHTRRPEDRFGYRPQVEHTLLCETGPLIGLGHVD